MHANNMISEGIENLRDGGGGGGGIDHLYYPTPKMAGQADNE